METLFFIRWVAGFLTEKICIHLATQSYIPVFFTLKPRRTCNVLLLTTISLGKHKPLKYVANWKKHIHVFAAGMPYRENTFECVNVFVLFKIWIFKRFQLVQVSQMMGNVSFLSPLNKVVWLCDYTELFTHNIFEYLSQIIINKEPTRPPSGYAGIGWINYNMENSPEGEKEVWDVKRLLEVWKGVEEMENRIDNTDKMSRYTCYFLDDFCFSKTNVDRYKCW